MDNEQITSAKDLVSYAAQDNPAKMGDAFDSLMRDKISSVLQQTKEVLAKTMFGAEEDPSEEDSEQIEDEVEDEDTETDS